MTTGYIFSVLTWITLCFGIGAIAFFAAQGSWTFTQSFEKEYHQCENSLASVKAAAIPQCTPVKCEAQDNGLAWVWTVTGIILWITGLLYWNIWAPKKVEGKKN